MKKLLTIAIMLSFAFHAYAQTGDQKAVEVGDVLTINEPSAQKFKHIHFPRANFIIKKGGIANYKSLSGDRVEVTAIHTKADGTKEVVLKRVNGHKFFNSYPTVKADIDKALKAGELRF